MSVLNLKQILYQQDCANLEQALHTYYTDSKISLNKVQKAYRCYETDVHLNDKKISAGFGRSEDEATVNAARIALEALVDSADQNTLERLTQIFNHKQEDELKKFLEGLGLSEYYKVLVENQCGLEELKKLEKEDLKKLIPIGPATRIYTLLNPKPSKLEKLEKVINKDSTPSYLICPISQEIMEDPVSTSDGHTYERASITQWLRNSNTSPITGLPLPNKSLRPNYALRLAIQHYQEIMSVFSGKMKPKLSTEPCKDLYKTVFAPQFDEPYQDFSEEVLQDMTNMANKCLEGKINLSVAS